MTCCSAMQPLPLPGLERLIAICQSFLLGVNVDPPARHPAEAGALVEGLPFDPVLAAVYARLGDAALGTRLGGISILSADDESDGRAESNRLWREQGQKEVALPLFLFAAEPGTAYYYATVPSLADERRYQPVVHVADYALDDYMTLPIASDVDRFFNTYARYLEALVAHPAFPQEGEVALTFPWDVPELIREDARLVSLIRAGRFDSVMKADDSVRRWLDRVLAANDT